MARSYKQKHHRHQRFLIRIRENGKHKGYYALHNKQMAICSSPNHALQYKNAEEAQAALLALSSKISRRYKLEVFAFVRQKGRKAPSRLTPEQRRQKRESERIVIHSYVPSSYDEIKSPEEQQKYLEHLKDIAARPTSARGAAEKLNAELGARSAVDCKNCGICRDCLDRQRQLLSNYIKKDS